MSRTEPTTTARPGTSGGAGSFAARVLIAPIRFYQRFISPALPPTCRYAPSCSAYAVTALREYGALRGSWLAIAIVIADLLVPLVLTRRPPPGSPISTMRALPSCPRSSQQR